MPLFEAKDSVSVAPGLYGDLERSMGKNFNLLQETVGLKRNQPRGLARSQKHGGHGSSRGPPSKPLVFPPLLRQFKVAGGDAKINVHNQQRKPITMTKSLRDELSSTLGAGGVSTLEESLGFADRSWERAEVVEANPPPVFKDTWGSGATLPKYKFSRGPHQSKIKGKFYWPNMTNDKAHIPVTINPPREVQDLSSWLNTYGTPDPGKIPQGFLTTFRAVNKRVGKEKSKGLQLINKASGAEWFEMFERVRGGGSISK